MTYAHMSKSNGVLFFALDTILGLSVLILNKESLQERENGVALYLYARYLTFNLLIQVGSV